MREALPQGPKIVLDVEATCWATLPPDRTNWVERRSEVIEIGMYVPRGLAVPGAGKSASFMIRPVMNPVLTDFCTSLTSITQEMVAAAKLYADVLLDIDAWCLENVGSLLAETPWSSWGFYDLNIICANSMWFKARPTFREDMHLNVKEMARRVRIAEDGVRTLAKSPKTGKFAVGEGLRFFGLGAFQGTQHRGVDDAVNIGRIWESISGLFTADDFVRHAGHSRSINESFCRKNGLRPG